MLNTWSPLVWLNLEYTYKFKKITDLGKVEQNRAPPPPLHL